MCPEGTFECTQSHVTTNQPSCVSTERRCDGVTDCIGGEDELDHNCPCGPEGAVRLVDGIVPYRGRIEFCKNGLWFTICNNPSWRWENVDATIVCHQLGYSTGNLLLADILSLCLTNEYLNVRSWRSIMLWTILPEWTQPTTCTPRPLPLYRK